MCLSDASFRRHGLRRRTVNPGNCKDISDRERSTSPPPSSLRVSLRLQLLVSAFAIVLEGWRHQKSIQGSYCRAKCRMPLVRMHFTLHAIRRTPYGASCAASLTNPVCSIAALQVARSMFKRVRQVWSMSTTPLSNTKWPPFLYHFIFARAK